MRTNLSKACVGRTMQNTFSIVIIFFSSLLLFFDSSILIARAVIYHVVVRFASHMFDVRCDSSRRL